MPFKSQAQRAFMYSQHPEIAKRWRKESGPQKGLPEHKAESSSSKQAKGPKGTKKQKKHLTQGYRNA